MNQFKSQWLLREDVVFLNHGSFGACPREVFEYQTELRRRMESEPVEFLWREIERPLDESREAVAAFLGTSAANLAFVTNATSAVNAVVRSMEFSPGDEILTTDHGYNACNNVLLEVARRSGARVVFAPIPFPLASAAEILEAVLQCVTPRTRLAMLDHVTSPTAIIFPVLELTRELEARGVEVLIDGAHAPGMLPLDLEVLRPAYYTGNLHKWICAPKGCAFLYVREDRQESVRPAVISHGENTRRDGRSIFHDRFDWQGTGDVTAWLAARKAIEWCASLLPGGLGALMRANHELAVHARRLLCERLELEAPCPEGMIGSMATLPLPERFQTGSGSARAVIERFDPDQTRLFKEFGIEIPFIRWGDPVRRWFRISAQAYNSIEDYQRLAEAMTQL